MIVAETKCATQWNSDAIERLGRQREYSTFTHGGGREEENVWWFRSRDEVQRQAASSSDLGFRS